jgi:uncharacterized protein (TIGR02246 family)
VNPKDDEAIRNVVTQWQQCWNCGDMAAAAALFCEDADFVNVSGSHWHGRSQIESEHSSLHRSFLKGSVIAPLDVGVQIIGADAALVHVHWSHQRRDPDGAAQPALQRMFSCLVLRDGQNRWLIKSAHNTNISATP